MFGDASEHAWTDFLAIVKCKRNVCTSSLCKNPMRTSLPFDVPTAAQKRFEHLLGFNGSPLHTRKDGKPA